MTTAVNSSGPVKLTSAQLALQSEIAKGLSNIMSRIHSHVRTSPEEIRRLGEKAAELHKSLRDSGVTVRHHKYMIVNRGMKPDDPGFYDHVHPIQDLLKYIDNQSANRDPEDQTIDHDFEFVVYSRRWGHTETYRFKRTRTGWSVNFAMGPIATAKDGRVGGKPGTGVFHLLDHDSINFPEDLPGYLKWLWERAAEDGLKHDQVQEALTTLAEWVSLVEKHSPEGIFTNFK